MERSSRWLVVLTALGGLAVNQVGEEGERGVGHRNEKFGIKNGPWPR